MWIVAVPCSAAVLHLALRSKKAYYFYQGRKEEMMIRKITSICLMVCLVCISST